MQAMPVKLKAVNVNTLIQASNFCDLGRPSLRIAEAS